MTNNDKNKLTMEVKTKSDLIGYVASGCKPATEWVIGTEHEKFGYKLSDYRPLPYGGPSGIQAMLEGLRRFGWIPKYENNNVIALTKVWFYLKYH